MRGDCVINLLISYTFGISIHAPRMGSDIIMQMVAEVYPISIHVSSVVSDFNLINSTMISLYFNSCSLCGERPSHRVFRLHAVDFSIHVPRMRSDSARKVDMFSYKFFSRFSCGERLSISFKAPTILSFQFTLLE